MKEREIVYDILFDVKYNEKYSNVVLNNVLNSRKFKVVEKNFITFLVYGILSNINYLDFFIKKLSKIRFSKISKKARIILEIGFFEMIFMNNSQVYATINECVNLAKKKDFRSKDFTNGVLRNLDRYIKKNNIENIRNYEFKEINDIVEKISIKYSVSESIARRFLKNYGVEFTENLLEEMKTIPEVFIVGNKLLTNFYNLNDYFSKLATKNKLDFKVIDEKNLIFSFKNFKNIKDDKFFKLGYFHVMDLASIKAVLALNPKENERILDLCAAPGGKSLLIGELMNNKGEVLSLDISKNKLEMLNESKKRLKIDIITTMVNDSSKFNEKLLEKGFYDKVLVDAPCIGLGTIRRKPEIRYKNIGRFNLGEKPISEIQKEIIKNGAKYLKKGGILLYSTCSLGKEENEDIINNFIFENGKEFKVEFMKEFYPHIDKTDGFFICKICKL